MNYIIVLVTTATKQEAEKISLQLLDDKLIACANIVGPITSIYRWSKEIERAEEFLIFMKSRRDLFNDLTKVVNALHSYKVPEILALQVQDGSKTYLDWLENCLI